MTDKDDMWSAKIIILPNLSLATILLDYYNLSPAKLFYSRQNVTKNKSVASIC